MKGEIFNGFEEFISTNWGVSEFEAVLVEAAPSLATKEPFIGPGTYPDSDFLILLTCAQKQLKFAIEPGIRSFGKFLFPILASKFPNIRELYPHPKQLLLAVEGVIHIEVRKMWSDTVLPRFTYEDPAPDLLVMIYDSPRRLFALVEGLIDGAAAFYDTNIDVERVADDSLPDTSCRYHLRFSNPLIV